MLVSRLGEVVGLIALTTMFANSSPQTASAIMKAGRTPLPVPSTFGGQAEKVRRSLFGSSGECGSDFRGGIEWDSLIENGEIPTGIVDRESFLSTWIVSHTFFRPSRVLVVRSLSTAAIMALTLVKELWPLGQAAEE